MTEEARTVPDELARELRALNDLELGALVADLGALRGSRLAEAIRERLHALAEVRAVPGGRHAGELAPSSCPAAELPARMGRIWAALVARAESSPTDRLIASRDAALAREADAVAELLRWRQWAVKVAPESAEGTNDGLRGRVGWLVVSHRERAATEEASRHGLAAAVEALGDAARDALAEAQTTEIPPGAAERVALLARRFRERGELIAGVRAALGSPSGVSLIAHAREVAGRAGAPPVELRDELAGVKRERDNLRREVQQNRIRSAEVGDELAEARADAEHYKANAAAIARSRDETWAKMLAAREALALPDDKTLEVGLGDLLTEVRNLRGGEAAALAELGRWRSWAIQAGQLTAAEIVSSARDDARLRECAQIMIRRAREVDHMADELAKAQRARKSLEGRFAAAHEEGRLEAEALHKGRGLELDAWRQWARSHLASASAIVNDGGLRIELSRLLEALEARREFAELRDAARTMLPEGSTPNPATGWLADVIRGAAARADSLTRARDLAHENANRARAAEGAAVLRAEAAEAKVARLLAPPAVINLPPALHPALDAVQDIVTGVEATPEGLGEAVVKLVAALRIARRGWAEESGAAARARVELRSLQERATLPPSAMQWPPGSAEQLAGLRAEVERLTAELSKRADPEAVRKISAQANTARQLAEEVRGWESLAERLAKALADRDASRRAAEELRKALAAVGDLTA